MLPESQEVNKLFRDKGMLRGDADAEIEDIIFGLVTASLSYRTVMWKQPCFTSYFT